MQAKQKRCSKDLGNISFYSYRFTILLKGFTNAYPPKKFSACAANTR